MKLNTHLFNGEVFGFPPPALPLLPRSPPHRISFTDALGSAPAGRYFDYSRGRYALHMAFRLAGLGPGKALLAPAYHCRTMIDPALRLGAELGFYSLPSSLDPDLGLIDQAYGERKADIKALLVTHYFGQVRDLTNIFAWCKTRGIVLIEDASQALLTPRAAAKGIGIDSDLVVSSPYKFFPGDDGGLLFIPAHFKALPPAPVSPPIKEELAAIYHAWLRFITRQRPPDSTRLSDQVKAAKSQPAACPNAVAPWLGHTAHYQPQLEGRRSLAASRWTMHRHDPVAIASARRKNFSQLLLGLGKLKHGRPLIEEMTDAFVPYMFPLLIDFPEPHFFWLKRLGVPIWRWDEQAVTACPTASRYRLHLLHLPCHQSLSENDLAWMIEATRLILDAPLANHA